ncbi:MAG: hypothetical protein K8U03_19125 [Planctomycetia bacterium]|nr:hypothetical protein [Planctomycetia bacterium]
MVRFIGLASIVLLSAFQTGCCSSPCGKGMGCGRSYWGAYADNPPTCEPCDTYGNWTGSNCGPCGKGGSSPYPWERTRGRRVTLFGSLFGCCSTSGRSTSCSEPSCGEPDCGEPSCGEPNCGSEPDCGCGHSSNLDTAAPAPQASNGRSPRMSNVSYSRTASNGSANCNCGRH